MSAGVGPPPYQVYEYTYSRSVRGLGRAVEALLGLYLLANIALIFPVWHEITLLDRLGTDRVSVSIDEAQRADDTVRAVALLLIGFYLAVIVVWLVWFVRMRRNVEAWRPAFQRRGRGWAIGAWFCPIVNYWFPYQIARDVLDDTEQDVNGAMIRPSRPLLLIWWLAFVGMSIMDVITTRYPDDTLDELRRGEYLQLVDIAVTVVAAVLAIAVARSMTGAQTARRARVYAAIYAPATASGS
jgi:hypothetical protein